MQNKEEGTITDLPKLTVRMLGTFQVVREDGVVPRFRSQKTKWMLAFLVLQRGREVEFKLLKQIFWPEQQATKVGMDPQEPAKDEFASVRQSLNNLRALLSPQRFTKLSRQSVKLETQAMSVDLYAFDANLRNGFDPALQQAVACYTGDLLAECGEDWIKTEREKRRRGYLRALQQLTKSALEAGDYEGAKQSLRQLVATEPDHEEWTIHLARLLRKCGEAVAAREVCEHYFARRPKLKPGKDLQALYDALGNTPPAAPSLQANPSGETSLAAKYSLPFLPEPLIGRDQDVASIAVRLAFGRMVTLKGPPGVGKTQLALRVCAEVCSDYPDGTPFVDLTEAKELCDVERKLMACLQVPRSQEGSDAEALVKFLEPRQILVVLDNCQHLVGSMTSTIRRLLRFCPKLRLLTTSQLAWRDIAVQQIYHVKGLAVPDPAQWQRPDPEREALLQVDAIRLYLREAANVQPDLALTPQSLAAIAQLCHHLDGLPLGIKLAASQAQIRSPIQTLQALLQDPRSLGSFPSDLSPSPLSLWSAIESSIALLPADLQRTFAYLAVFQGGWTMDGAEKVIGSPSVDKELQRLMDRSLVYAIPMQDAPRFHMLETIHRFSEDCLNRLAEAPLIRGRHLQFYIKCAEAADSTGPEQNSAFDQLEREWSNLQGALEWAMAAGQAEQGLRLAAALGRYWYVRGDNRAGSAWLDRMLADCAQESPAPCSQGSPAPCSQALRARALRAAGNLALQRADYERARACYEEQLACYEERLEVERTADSLTGLAGAHGSLGNVCMMKKDHAGAQHHFQRSRAISEELGDERGLSRTLGNLAILACDTGDFALACRHHEAAVELSRRMGDHQNLITALNNLADTQLSTPHLFTAQSSTTQLSTTQLFMEPLSKGQIAESAETLRESLALCIEADYRLGLAHCLFLHARLALQRGMMESAGRLLGGARGVRERSGLVFHAGAAAEQRQCCDAIRTHIGTSALDCAMDEGRVMPIADLMACAASVTDPVA